MNEAISPQVLLRVDNNVNPYQSPKSDAGRHGTARSRDRIGCLGTFFGTSLVCGLVFYIFGPVDSVKPYFRIPDSVICGILAGLVISLAIRVSSKLMKKITSHDRAD